MMRITRVECDDSGVELRIEGRLVAEWVALLEAECQRLLDRYTLVDVDLSAVSYTDPQGARVLRSLANERLRLRNVPPLLEEILSAEASSW